jgi:hypothetical protein
MRASGFRDSHRSGIKSEKDKSVILNEHEATSSIREGSGIRAPGTTLAIFRLHGLSRVDFLKMNIEGAERLALSGMGERLCCFPS